MTISIKTRMLLGSGLVLSILIAASVGNGLLLQGIRREAATLTAARVQMDYRDTPWNSSHKGLRVRVNQWLRSMNPEFAKDADQLLSQLKTLLVRTRCRNTARPGQRHPGPERKGNRRIQSQAGKPSKASTSEKRAYTVNRSRNSASRAARRDWQRAAMPRLPRADAIPQGC